VDRINPHVRSYERRGQFDQFRQGLVFSVGAAEISHVLLNYLLDQDRLLTLLHYQVLEEIPLIANLDVIQGQDQQAGQKQNERGE